MGSNLLLTRMFVPATIELAHNTLKGLIAELTPERLAKVQSLLAGAGLIEFDGAPDDPDEALADLEDVRQRLEDAVEVLSDDNRELAYYSYGPGLELLAGGMSWGDDPSESYTDLQILAMVDSVLRQDLPFTLTDHLVHLIGDDGGPTDIENVADAGMNGDYSMSSTCDFLKVSKEEARYILESQGSDPSFLISDEEDDDRDEDG